MQSDNLFILIILICIIVIAALGLYAGYCMGKKVSRVIYVDKEGNMTPVPEKKWFKPISSYTDEPAENEELYAERRKKQVDLHKKQIEDMRRGL